MIDGTAIVTDEAGLAVLLRSWRHDRSVVLCAFDLIELDDNDPAGARYPTFAEAWCNLGDLLDDQGRSEAATECCAKACKSRLTTSTQCSTWRWCSSEKINTPRRQIIGAVISLSTANRNGLHAHAVH
ncbi:MAG TPA: tetratricopeptide repeat protein [Xanthobacteraceae bacterium]